MSDHGLFIEISKMLHLYLDFAFNVCMTLIVVRAVRINDDEDSHQLGGMAPLCGDGKPASSRGGEFTCKDQHSYNSV